MSSSAPVLAPERRTARAFLVLVVAAAHFGPAAMLVVAGTHGLAAVKGLVPAVLLSVAIAFAAALALAWRPSRGTRLLLAILLALAVPVFYDATGALIVALDPPLWDAALRGVDASLLGGLFPDGQMSVWIDRSNLVGPHTTLGRVLTEIFQVAYFSYYVWGYGLLILLLVRMGKGLSKGHAWRQVRMFLTAWVGAYLVNYAVYVIVPAMGPWFANPESYTHTVKGLWLTEPIRHLISSNQIVPDCFPSGHTALSWITAVAAMRFAPRYGRWAVGAAVLITLATVGLRYHYLVDVVSALPLILLGLWWGGFLVRSTSLSGESS